MKKISRFIILILLSFTLVSCIGYIKTENYVPVDPYEIKLIEAAEKVNNVTVSISNDEQVIGSAVIVAVDKAFTNYKYYAITVASNIVAGTKIYINHLNQDITYEVLKLYEDLNVAAISFETKSKLKTASIIKDNEVFGVFVGQSILISATDSRKEFRDAKKAGVVTKDGFDYNGLEDYLFTHNASLNYGENGSGVFDMDGNLVGINMAKTYYMDHNNLRENIYGLNEAIKIDVISNIIKNIKNLENVKVDERLNKVDITKTQVEKVINELYLSVESSIVNIIQNDENYSGLIYNKTGNDYSILTTKFETNEDLRVEVNGISYPVKNVEMLDENLPFGGDNYLSRLVVNTTDNLDVYSDNLFNNGNTEALTHGQTLVAVGSVNEGFQKLLGVGTVSKNNIEDERVFMHDLKLNAGQEGAPIFNLNGKLVGIYLNKKNEIQTSSGIISAEGLGYAYNLSQLNLDLNVVDYESKVINEQAKLDVIKSVNKSVVTVRTNRGHGSGVIFKKETQKNGLNLYYVMTNQHVIEAASEINIDFAYRQSIYAKDFQASIIYDMAVVRFESKEELEFVNSKVLDEQKGINYTVGQQVIAIGTPEDTINNNYVTQGIITTDPSHYDGINKLAVHHDAALNPGNSGGPLFDLQGNLIGINVAKKTFYTTPIGDVFAERLSISLNINTVSEIFNLNFKIFAYEAVLPRPPRLGISVSNLANLIEDAKQAELEGKESYYNTYKDKIPAGKDGVLVVGVEPNLGSFGKLMTFDLIIQINERNVVSLDDVSAELTGAEFGNKYNIKVKRIVNGETVTVDVVVELI